MSGAPLSAVRRWASMAVAVATVSVAVVLLVRDEAALAALRALRPWAAATVLGLQTANVFTDSVRYRMVVPRRYRETIPRWRWHHVFSVGRLLNQAVPQAGMAYRAARLRFDHALPVSSFVGGVAAISWLGNAVALALTGAVLAAVGAFTAAGVVLGAAVLVFAVVVGLPRLAAGRAGGRMARLPMRLREAAARFAESFVELASRPGHLGRVLAVSVATQMTGVAAYVVVSASLGVADPLVTGAILYTTTTIATVVALTPGGLGITELAAAAAARVLDVGAGTGVLAALMIRVTGMAALILLVLVSTVADRRARRVPDTTGP